VQSSEGRASPLREAPRTQKKTKAQITQDLRDGKIDADEMMGLMKEAARLPPRFAVADQWGCRFGELMATSKGELMP
jgi:hypothetical protein